MRLQGVSASSRLRIFFPLRIGTLFSRINSDLASPFCRTAPPRMNRSRGFSSILSAMGSLQQRDQLRAQGGDASQRLQGQGLLELDACNLRGRLVDIGGLHLLGVGLVKSGGLLIGGLRPADGCRVAAEGIPSLPQDGLGVFEIGRNVVELL